LQWVTGYLPINITEYLNILR